MLIFDNFLVLVLKHSLFSHTSPNTDWGRQTISCHGPGQSDQPVPDCGLSLAALATARPMVLVSTGMSCWGSSAASFATVSARSLPAILQWDDTHCALIWRWSSSCDSRESAHQMVTPSGYFWAVGPDREVAREAMLSLQITMRTSWSGGRGGECRASAKAGTPGQASLLGVWSNVARPMSSKLTPSRPARRSPTHRLINRLTDLHHSLKWLLIIFVVHCRPVWSFVAGVEVPCVQLAKFSHGRRPEPVWLLPGLTSSEDGRGPGDGAAHVAGSETGVTRHLADRLSSDAGRCGSPACIGKWFIKSAWILIHRGSWT